MPGPSWWLEPDARLSIAEVEETVWGTLIKKQSGAMKNLGILPRFKMGRGKCVALRTLCGHFIGHEDTQLGR